MKVSIPTCYECGDRFTINRKEKSSNKYGKCDTCGLVDMCWECAIFVSDDDNDGMECLMCHQNRQIEKELEGKGIIKTKEGVWIKEDCGMKVFIGNSYLDRSVRITDEEVDENELDVKEIVVDASGNPVCAFGYCCEELYNRGCLDGWENKWICEECEDGLIYNEGYDGYKKIRGIDDEELCERPLKDGTICTNKVLSGYEYCGECMEIETGMYNEDYSDVYDDDCKYCGWRSEYPESHIRYGNTGCKYITDKYNLDFDEDGEIIFSEK